MTSGVSSTLKEQSRLPLSLRLKYTLRARLERGEWLVGSCIPTLHELAAEYCVSRATVRAALDELAREGLIERIRGKGTFVIGDAAKEHWLMLPTDWGSLVRHIENLNVEFTELGSGTGPLPEQLVDARQEGNFWWATRVNWSDGIPYSISTVHVALLLVQEKRAEFEANPVLLTLRRHFGHELHSAEQTLTVRIADAMAAKELRVDIGMPIVRVVRVARNASGEVVYAVRVLYPAKYLCIRNDLKPWDVAGTNSHRHSIVQGAST